MFSWITRPDPQNIFGGSCMDNMYLKTKNLTIKAFKITTPFTDHYPLFLTFDARIHSDTKKQNNKTINYKKLINIASSIDWNSILTMQNLKSASEL